MRLADGSVARWAWWWCPGCAEPHAVPLEGQNSVGAGPWALGPDGASLTPSVNVRGWPADAATGARGHPVCHAFVIAGRIQFLGDCGHALAGQTVDVPPWPELEGGG